MKFQNYLQKLKLEKGEEVYAESDTFVFVEGKLIIHRRAKYTYYDSSKA